MIYPTNKGTYTIKDIQEIANIYDVNVKEFPSIASCDEDSPCNYSLAINYKDYIKSVKGKEGMDFLQAAKERYDDINITVLGPLLEDLNLKIDNFKIQTVIEKALYSYSALEKEKIMEKNISGYFRQKINKTLNEAIKEKVTAYYFIPAHGSFRLTGKNFISFEHFSLSEKDKVVQAVKNIENWYEKEEKNIKSELDDLPTHFKSTEKEPLKELSLKKLLQTKHPIDLNDTSSKQEERELYDIFSLKSFSKQEEQVLVQEYDTNPLESKILLVNEKVDTLNLKIDRKFYKLTQRITELTEAFAELNENFSKPTFSSDKVRTSSDEKKMVNRRKRSLAEILPEQKQISAEKKQRRA